MSDFEQEWISPILEVYKKGSITHKFSVILGLNPLGQMLCRHIYERNTFDTILVFNSPSFAVWNRYPADVKPPVIPVQGMVSSDLMLLFGDVIIREYEWVPDLLFYLQGNVPTQALIALMTHDGPTCGQATSSKGESLLSKMEVKLGRSDFYDGLIAPLLSVGPVAELDPVVIFLEESTEKEVLLQIDDKAVCVGEVERALRLLEAGLDLKS
ncbi:MAG: hypothetical protein ACFE8Z_06440 [Candidatus Hermodarchaeota archaeon]